MNRDLSEKQDAHQSEKNGDLQKSDPQKPDPQKTLFDEIRRRLPSNVLVADAVADFLGVSTDAAYRRIRGDKRIDLAEAMALATKFHIPLESLGGAKSG